MDFRIRPPEGAVFCALLVIVALIIVQGMIAADGGSLSFLSERQFWGEVARLAAQGAGALVVARLAVSWALSRFKSEKSWERETAALADVLAAIYEMQRVNDRWYKDEIERRDTSPEHDEGLRKRWREAKAKVDSVAAIAAIVLPPEVAVILKQLDDALLRGDHNSWSESLDEAGGALTMAIAAINKFADGRR